MRRRPPAEEEPEAPWDPEAPVPLPLDGELDLHLFQPRDVDAVVEEYLGACREAGVLQIRIAHGKGTGAQRRRVQALLARLSMVQGYRAATESDGGWGATWVQLLPPQESQK